MAENSDPQVVKFANEEIRSVANDLVSLYWRAQRVVQAYNSTGIGAKIAAAGATELVSDGSVSDGRTRIDGNDILNIITALQQFVLYIENGAVTRANRVDVVTKPSTRDGR